MRYEVLAREIIGDGIGDGEMKMIAFRDPFGALPGEVRFRAYSHGRLCSFLSEDEAKRFSVFIRNVVVAPITLAEFGATG